MPVATTFCTQIWVGRARQARVRPPRRVTVGLGPSRPRPHANAHPCTTAVHTRTTTPRPCPISTKPANQPSALRCPQGSSADGRPAGRGSSFSGRLPRGQLQHTAPLRRPFPAASSGCCCCCCPAAAAAATFLIVSGAPISFSPRTPAPPQEGWVGGGGGGGGSLILGALHHDQPPHQSRPFTGPSGARPGGQQRPLAALPGGALVYDV